MSIRNLLEAFNQNPFPTELIGSVFGPLVIFLVGFIGRRISRETQISYRILADEELMDPHRQVYIREFADEKHFVPIDNRQVAIQLINSGRTFISPDMFEYAITVEFGGDSKLIGGPLLLDCEPPDLQPHIRLNITKSAESDLILPSYLKRMPNSISVSPLLLNPGDWPIIGLLVRSRESSLIVKGRIAGVERIRPFVRDDVIASIQVLTLFTLLLMQFHYITWVNPDLPTWRGWPLLLFQVVAMILLTAYPSRPSRERINNYRAYSRNPLVRMFQVTCLGSPAYLERKRRRW